MTDVHSKQVRSYNMSKISGKNTKPEIVVRKFLHKTGFRFRLHSVELPGKPDLIFPSLKIAIFVNGCFWHGHENCKHYVIPKTRTDWWTAKLNRNIARDKNNIFDLKKLGWKVLVIWECELKKNAEKKLQQIAELLTQAKQISNS